MSSSSVSAQSAVQAVEPGSYAVVDPDPARGWELLQALEFVTGQRLPFEEVTKSRFLKAPSVARGELWMDELGVLTMQLREPVFERRTLAQDRLTLTRLRRAARQSLNRDPASSGSTGGADPKPDPDPEQLFERSVRIDGTRPAQVLLRAIATLLRGDLASLKATFSIISVRPRRHRDLDSGATGGANGGAGVNWAVALKPRAEQLARRLPAVRLVGRGARLLSIDADRGAQGRQIVRLLDEAVGGAVEGSDRAAGSALDLPLDSPFDLPPDLPSDVPSDIPSDLPSDLPVKSAAAAGSPNP